MDTIRMAVIGLGNMGTAHATCIDRGAIPGMTLTAVCDIRDARLDWAREHLPSAERFTSWEALAASGTADAVLIATPHPLHALIAEGCLRAGLHVLSEKPADVSVARARRALAAAQETGLTYAVMLNQRTNPVFRRAREIVQGGELGALKRSVWIITNWYRTQHYYDSGDWRATWDGEGGGVLLNQAPHNLDLWQWICGMPCEVTAFCDVARYHRIEVEDDATILARYPGGATGVFVTSTGEFPGTNRLEISGELGKLVLEGGVIKWWRLRENERDVRFSSAENSPSIPCDCETFTPEGEETAHAGILRNFAAHILRGEPLLSPASDALCELTISNAAYLSAWRGSAPVAVPFDEAAFDEALRARADEACARPKDRSASAPDGQYSRRWQVNW